MNVKITYFDTAMALIEIGSLRLLTDPVLDAAGSTYDDGVLPLEKVSAKSVTPEELGRIDAILLSHDQHGDNLDTGGRELLKTVREVLTTPEAAARLGGNAIGLARWQTHEVVGSDGFTVTITAAPAQHGPDGTEEMTGTVTGFIIDWTGRTGRGPIYISGDTVPFAGTAEIVERVAPVSVALLHMGHVTPAPGAGIFFSMSSEEAANYATALNAEVLVPLHFDGWKHFSEPAGQAVENLQTVESGSRIEWLTPRQSLALEM